MNNLKVLLVPKAQLDIQHLESVAWRDGSACFIKNHAELTQAEKHELHYKNLYRLSGSGGLKRSIRDEEVRVLKQQLASSKGLKPRIRVTDVLIQDFIDLYCGGYSTQAISDAYEGTVSKATVQKHLSYYDIVLPNNLEKRGQVIEFLDDIRALDVRKWRSSCEGVSFEHNNKNTKTEKEKINLTKYLYHQKLAVKVISKRAMVPVLTVKNYIQRNYKSGL